MLKSSLAVAMVAAVVSLAFPRSAAARGPRVGQIPNGAVFGCAVCHVDPAGGGTRTSFGQSIYDDYLTEQSYLGSVKWGPELAALDADGDGATNGRELGDPEGTWQVGDPDPGDPAAVTEPWNADSKPAPPTAVKSSSWAWIKALLTGE